jgi:hypothetical protein
MCPLPPQNYEMGLTSCWNLLQVLGGEGGTTGIDDDFAARGFHKQGA